MPQYFAKSIFLSTTFWVNVGMFIVAALELSEVTAIIPNEWNGAMAAVAALVNLALRFTTVRPVALIAPGETKPVQVKHLL
jgi:hypothetical protein